MKRGLPIVIATGLLAVAGCGKKAQTAESGVELLCQTPSQMPGFKTTPKVRLPAAITAYWATAITHENVAVLRDILVQDPEAAGPRLADEAKGAGLDRCPMAEVLPTLWPPAPVAVRHASALPDNPMALVIVTASTLAVEGEAVTLETLGKAIAVSRQTTALFHVAGDVRHDRLLAVLRAAVGGKIERPLLAVKGPSGPGVVALHLEKGDASGAVVSGEPAVDPNARSLRAVVSITPDRLALWSFTGLLGTMREPRLLAKPGDVDKLGDVLREEVDRRWKGRQRPTATRAILFVAESEATFSTVAPVVAAMARDETGPLFPDVQLGMMPGGADRYAAPPPDDETPTRATPRWSIAVDVPDEAFASEPIARRIKALYRAGILRCAAGVTEKTTLTIRARLAETGRVEDGAVEGQDEVGACLTPLVNKWRFGRPARASVFVVTLTITPSS